MKFPFVFRSTYDHLQESYALQSRILNDAHKGVSVLDNEISSLKSEIHASRFIIDNLKQEIEDNKKRMLTRGNYEMTRSLYYFLRRMISDKDQFPYDVIEIFNISAFHRLGSETRKYLYQGLSDILYGKNNTRNKEEV